MKRVFCIALSIIAFSSCKNETKESATQAEVKEDTVKTVDPSSLEVKNADQLTNDPGVIGLFDVPEMLTISKADSCGLSQMASRLAKTYSAIQKDIALTKAEVNGAPGTIYYNSDTANFVFECVIPISQIPKIQPKNSQVVVLEPSKMLIYNYYGAYKDLNLAYEELNVYKLAYNLQQLGPMREFYITDPLKVKDTSKWLTRIMIPVK